MASAATWPSWPSATRRALPWPLGNRLEIDICNLWPNRLIGDARLPPEKRFTRTSVAFGADAALLPSGLLGPVRILIERDARAATGSRYQRARGASGPFTGHGLPCAARETVAAVAGHVLAPGPA